MGSLRAPHSWFNPLKSLLRAKKSLHCQKKVYKVYITLPPDVCKSMSPTCTELCLRQRAWNWEQVDRLDISDDMLAVPKQCLHFRSHADQFGKCHQDSRKVKAESPGTKDSEGPNQESKAKSNILILVMRLALGCLSAFWWFWRIVRILGRLLIEGSSPKSVTVHSVN